MKTQKFSGPVEQNWSKKLEQSGAIREPILLQGAWQFHLAKATVPVTPWAQHTQEVPFKIRAPLFKVPLHACLTGSLSLFRYTGCSRARMTFSGESSGRCSDCR